MIGVMLSIAGVTVAQAARAGNARATQAALVWTGVLLVAVLVGAVVVFFVRRQMVGGDPSDGAMAGGGLLDELRQMHRRGEIGDDEFERARAAMLARATGKPVAGAGAAGRTGGVGGPAGGGAETRVAPPGFDLTGSPLPPRAGDGA